MNKQENDKINQKLDFANNTIKSLQDYAVILKAYSTMKQTFNKDVLREQIELNEQTIYADVEKIKNVMLATDEKEKE